MTNVPETNVPAVPAKNPAPELRTELRNWCEAWKTCLQNVLSQVSEQPAAFEISFEPLPAADSDVWYTVVAGGAVHGEMTLRLSVASGTRLAQKFLGETAPAATEPIAPESMASENIAPENKEALEELLRQIAGLAATALAALAGGEVQLHLSPSAAPSWSSDAIVCLESRNEAEGGVSVAIEIQISPALAAALQPRVQAAPPPQTSAKSSALPSPPSSIVSPPASSYGRLMDVGLDVKLRFGTRRMLLRDVLALSAGVVVELDNPLHSPVDLLLDGRLIAQGEVVVVDGKYGLRVTDVVDSAPAAGSPV
jgi:flagellar motor switch protein FliN